MTTSYESRLQLALRDLADEVGPAPVHRWAAPPPARPAVRRWTPVAVVAAVVAAVVLAASIIVLRLDEPSVVEPVRQPPKVVRVSTTDMWAPGKSLFGFGVVTRSEARPVYLVRGGSRDTIRLADPNEMSPVSGHGRHQLSLDGRSYLLQTTLPRENHQRRAAPTIILVDLVTGLRDTFDGLEGFCPELSADAGRIAFVRGTDLQLLDTSTRTVTTLVKGGLTADNWTGCSVTLGWSPDGRLLAVGNRGDRAADGTTVMTLQGQAVATVPGQLANASMSWSPDGASVLTYDPGSGRHLVATLDGAPPARMRPPRDAVGAVGWAGSRVVWLVGGPGEQRLVSTDRHGRDPQPWLRFDVSAGLSVATVQWSRDLYGTAGG